MTNSRTPWQVTRFAQRELGLPETGVWDDNTDSAYLGGSPAVKAAIDRVLTRERLSAYSLRRVTTQVTEPVAPDNYSKRKADRAGARSAVKPNTRSVAPGPTEAPAVKRAKASDPAVKPGRGMSVAAALGSNPSSALMRQVLQNLLTQAGYAKSAVDAILRQVQKESGFRWDSVENHRYFNTRPRMRAFERLDQSAIRALAQRGPEAFFEAAYGHTTAKGKELGNVHPGDGGKFLGRGLLQETGRFNYTRLGRRIGVDLENDPGAINRTPEAAVRSFLGTVESRFGSRKTSLSDRDVLASINPGLLNG